MEISFESLWDQYKYSQITISYIKSMLGNIRLVGCFVD